MRFSVSSCPPAAARIAASALSLSLLLLLCVARGTEVAARQIDRRSAGDVSSSPPTLAAVPVGPTYVNLPETPGDAAGDKRTEVSYESTDAPEPEATVAAAAAGSDDSADSDFEYDSGTITEPTGSQWIQKIPHTRPYAKFPRNLRDPEEHGPDAFKSPGNPLSMGQVILNAVYGPAWPALRTSSKCYEDMKLYNTHLQNFTFWAAKMLDATSKGPEGLFDGNTFSFGSYDQCLNTKSKIHGISGGYSLVNISYRPSYKLHPGFYDDDHLDDFEPLDEDGSAWKAINHNIQEGYIQRHEFHWGVCLPDTCNYNDVQKIVSDVLIPKMNQNGLEANVTIDPLLHTSSKTMYKYSVGFFLVCAMFVLLFVLVVVSTLYDLIFLYYRPKSEHGPLKLVFKPFSLISNIERLLKPPETEEFSVMNGLKCGCMLQIIVGHRWLIEFGNPQANPDFVHWLMHNMGFAHFKCTVFLETFFVISGFLTFYLVKKHLMEKKRLSFIPLMIYRWMRIFPVYATLILTYIFVLPYMNDGPYWRKLIYKESERCQTNWWANILFINNYVHTDEMCILPSWYLVCDFHFYTVGILLTYAIWKWEKQGLIMLGALLSLSTIIPSYIIVNEEHRGVMDISPDILHDLSKDRFFTDVYIKSHMRAMPYFIGVLTAYVYTQMKEANYKFSLKSRIICAPAVLIIGNIIYLTCGIFYIIGHDYNAYEHALYFTVARLVWSILVGYFIIGHGLCGFGVCISGYLGHRLFQVLGKLIFCAYMFQELIQLQTVGSIRTPTYQSLTLMGWRFCGDTFFALVYAFGINVMIESPFDRLQKNVMKLFFGNEFSKSKSNLPNKNIKLNSTA